RAVAAGCGNSCGFTSSNSLKAMFFMARATAPMLPGCEGATSTMRMSGESICYASLAADCHTSLRTVQPLLNIAVRAARRAGELIVRSLNRLESLTVSSKGRNDFVTEVDRAAEQEIIGSIRRLYPQHAFLAEESGRSGGEHETLWIIDPLDGTTNFLHGFPVFAVSIACQIRGRLEHAVVYDPMRGELFTASRGAGAHLDNHRMRVSKARALEGALIATGFPYRANTRYLDAYRSGSCSHRTCPRSCARRRTHGLQKRARALQRVALTRARVLARFPRIACVESSRKLGGSMARQLLATKSIAELHEQESTGNQLRRALTATQLTLLGIGGIIGTGIFVLTGTAAANRSEERRVGKEC